MVDAALFAIREIMEEFPEAVLYGQDVGEGWAVFSGKRQHWLNNLAITVFLILPSRKHILLVQQWACVQQV